MAGGMATMLLCTLLFSCNNEDFLESGNPEKACDNICFGISSDKNVQTRGYAGSDDEGYTADRFVLRSDDSADTLCVRAIVSDGINVSGFEGEQALTRATPVDKDNFYDKFHVLAYWSKNGASVDQFYMNTNASNSAASVGTGAKWSTEQIYYWPGADHSFQFYAWAPTDAGGLTTPSSPQDKSLAYTVPEAATDQKDIVVATTNEIQGDNNAAVPLTFKHICTAVRFAVGSQMQPGSIKSVALKGVKNAGTYDMAGGTWSIGNATVDFSQTLGKTTTGTPDEALTTDAQTFMMIPQTLPDGAQIEVVFTDKSNVDHTLTADIKGTVWPIGKTVTYKISSSSINWSYTLTVSGPADFTYTGGTQPYSVTSYRENTKGVQEAAPWTAQYSVDNGVSWTDTRPEWLTAFTASGAGGTSAQPYDATVSVQTGTDTSPHTTALQNATAKGTADTPYNLSNQTDGGPTDENTANCYVVSAPGYYSFPLVYGNALKNRSTNESAYKTGNTGSNILSNFINHTGAGISDPYIANNNGCTPAKAELVWQDVMDLVTDIKYNAGSNGGNISFKVDRFSIQQGNAVIAIKDASNNVLWSWHIWVTDENIDNVIEVTNYQNVKYNIMPVNLGWCDDDVTTYAERSCKVRFTAGDASKEVTIRQVSASITIRGNHPYYQWGRKDPLRPSNGLANTNKTWYDKNGTSSQSNPATENFSAGVTCIMNYILKPDVMQNQVSGDNAYANLWSVDNTVYTANDNPVVKTVYDPSPVGFKLPPGNVFTGFTTTGGSTSTSSEINGTWSSSSLKGWNFYTDSSKSKTIFFPASGYRFYSNGAASFVGSYGFCWSAVPYHQGNGRYLHFLSSLVSPLNGSHRAFGCGVRSCQE